MYARSLLENALKTNKNVEKQKTKLNKKQKNSGHFLRWPIEDMSHFVLFSFFFVVVINCAMKSNYSVINEKLSRDNETLSRDK